MNQTKVDTLTKDQTQKITPYAREEQKGEKRCMKIQQRLTATEKHNLFKMALVIL